jgi:magnesium-transporting ATPase (P-type)
LIRAYGFLGTFEAVAAMAAFFFLLLGAGWQWRESLSPDDLLYRQATTACLTAIVLMQVVNVHVCRSRRRSIFSRPLFENRLITLGIIVELMMILAINYTVAGNALFGTAPIESGVWLFILPFAAAMLILEEGRKAVVRWAERPSLTTDARPTGDGHEQVLT